MSLKKSTRREALAVLGAGVGAVLAGCGSTPTTPSSTTTPPTTGGGGTSSPASCAVTPAETEGPYPDRTGMINNAAFFRRDITEGKSGLPLTLTLTIRSALANTKKYVLYGLLGVVLVAVTIGLVNLKPAAQSVDRLTLIIDGHSSFRSSGSGILKTVSLSPAAPKS